MKQMNLKIIVTSLLICTSWLAYGVVYRSRGGVRRVQKLEARLASNEKDTVLTDAENKVVYRLKDLTLPSGFEHTIVDTPNKREIFVLFGGGRDDIYLLTKGDQDELIELKTLRGKPVELMSTVEISPDGNKLIIAGVNQATIYDISNVDSHKRIDLKDDELKKRVEDPWRSHKGGIFSVSFGEDGNSVVTRSIAPKGFDPSGVPESFLPDGTERTWDASTGQLIEEVKAETLMVKV